MSAVRKFAPLACNAAQHPRLLGVIFDLDGTLILPQVWMFKHMREALGIDKSIDILEHIRSLPDSESKIAMKAVEAIEEEAMLQMRAQEGLSNCLVGLRSHGVKVALCTRNFANPVNHFLKNVVADQLGIDATFSPVVDRSFHPPKPRGEPLLHIMEKWQISPENVIMVGDSKDDMLAGRRAKCATVLLGDSEMDENLVDKRVSGLVELMSVLREGFNGNTVNWKSV